MQSTYFQSIEGEITPLTRHFPYLYPGLEMLPHVGEGVGKRLAVKAFLGLNFLNYC